MSPRSLAKKIVVLVAMSEIVLISAFILVFAGLYALGLPALPIMLAAAIVLMIFAFVRTAMKAGIFGTRADKS